VTVLQAKHSGQHCRAWSIQGQAGWGFEQPRLEGGVFAYSRGLELDDLKGPFQHKPVYDSMICLQLPWAVVSINVSILLFNNGINTLVPCFDDITLFSVPLSLQSPSRGVEYAAQLVTQEGNVCVFGSTTIFPLCLTTYHSRALALTLDYAQPGRTCFCKGKCCEYLSAKLSQTANQPT